MKELNLQYPLKIVLPMLVLFVVGIIMMITNADYQWLLATFGFWVLMSGLGIAVGFHRIYSHQTYDPKPWLDKLILACGTLACQSSSLTWVAIHIGYHHKYADTERDPHTPTKGILHAFLKWTVYITPQTINHRYAVRLLKKPLHVWVHAHYFKIIWAFVVASTLLFGWKFTLYGYCIAAGISILQDNLVNVLGHWPSLGYRNFETKDVSSNFIPLGYLGWGQGWHNNHHHDPRSFDFGTSVSGKWWEFDPCRLFTPLLRIGSYQRNPATGG